MQTTIVTAYFQLPISKKSHGQYIQWMRNMLIIQTPMVIFTDAESKPLIQEIRGSLPTFYCVQNFCDFYTHRYETHFDEHQLQDHEFSIGHNTKLYMIWNEKSHFLKQASDLNPFQTDYFLWVDIGCFRKPNTDYLNWPNPNKIATLEPNKILMAQIYSFTHEEKQCKTLDSIPSFQFTNRIGGTMFGGTKGVIDKWHKEYYEMLEYFIHRGRFIGKDQSIMNSVYLFRPHLVQLVSQWKEPNRVMTSEWFYLHDFLM